MEYRREIDGLRALAVLPVILFHAGFSAFSGGYVGVDVFFVISGYLITSIILREKEAGTFTIRNFYERRIRRIFPALIVVLLACIVPAYFWMISSKLKEFSEAMIAVVFFVSNILFWRRSGYFETVTEENPLLHTWSLAVEEQYYVFFPLFIIIFWRLGRRNLAAMLAVAALVSFALCEYLWRTHPAANFFLTPPRIWELMIGALAAFACFKQPLHARVNATVNEVLSASGVLMIAGAVFFFDTKIPFPSAYTLLPTVGAVLVILFATSTTLAGRFLSMPICVGIGLVSYSAYLWHQPLFAFARITSIEHPHTIVFVGLAVLTFVLAYLTWRYIEAPFRNRRNFSTRQVFVGAGTVMASLVLLGTAGHLSKGLEFRLPGQAVEALAVVDRHNQWMSNDCNLEKEYRAPEMACVLGEKKSTPTIAIWGDSHAEMMTQALNNVLADRGMAALQFTADACPPVQNIEMESAAKDTNCQRFAKSTEKFLLNGQGPSTVILVARWTEYLSRQGFDNGLGGQSDDDVNAIPLTGYKTEQERVQKVSAAIAQDVRNLLQAGKKVILVYPVPEAGWRVPEVLAKRIFLQAEEETDLSVDASLQKERNAIAAGALDAIGEHTNLVRVRPREIFCNTFVKDRCVTQIGGIPLYFDSDHLSTEGASLVVKEIARHLQPESPAICRPMPSRPCPISLRTEPDGR